MAETFGINKQVMIGSEQRNLTAVELGCPEAIWKRVMELRGIRNVKGQEAADQRAMEMRFGPTTILRYTATPEPEPEPAPYVSDEFRRVLNLRAAAKRRNQLNSILSN